MAQDPESADAAGADAAPGGAARKARKPNPLANRIKRLMQTDEDVGKIAQASPALIGAALRRASRAQPDMRLTSTSQASCLA
jgi:Histone-like transcription factor (CBF/NF-Y) and archaeal histone